MSDDGWTWELSSTADGDLDGLSPADQDRLLDKLDEVVSSPWRDPPDYGEPSGTVGPVCQRREAPNTQ